MTAATAPWMGLAAVAAMLGILAVSLRAMQRYTDTAPETVRKLFHVGGGAVALALPWLFDTLWPVMLLGGVSVVVFVLMRVAPALKRGVGQILQAVPRESVGEFWFLLGVATLFAIARDEVVVYSIGILILAVADTAAALVGVFYGRHRFEVPGSHKTAEGSSAFLLTAFLCVHVPVLLFTDAGRLESLLIAANVAALLTLAEADAARGTDNFVLPLLVVVLLEVFLGMSAAGLATHLMVIVALGLLVFAYRNRTTLSPDALIGAVLVGYVIWSFGDWRWIVAPLLLFATYTLLVGQPRLEGSRQFHAPVLLAIVAPGMVLVTAYAVLAFEALYLPYVATWGANLAVIGTLHRQLEQPHAPAWRLGGINIAKACVVLVPGVLVASPYRAVWLIATLLTVPVALALFAVLGQSLKFEPTRPGAWISVSISVGLSTLFCFGLLRWIF